MKSLLIACTLAVSMNVHAESPARGMSTGAASPGMMGMHASHGAAAASQSGNGGRNSPSVVDDYQPWPESEMRQYQKPHWTPYEGE